MVLAGALVAALSVGGPAQAISHPSGGHRCVTWTEFHRTWHQADKRGDVMPTRAELEERWGVEGAGERRYLLFYGTAWVYPRCGFDESERVYGVHFENGKAQALIDWSVDDIQNG